MRENQISIKVGDMDPVSFRDNETGAGVNISIGGTIVFLNIRPGYQRELIYSIPLMRAVIMSILCKLSIGLIRFSRNADGTYEVLDGQQRLLSILHFIAGDYSVQYSGETFYYHNLPDDLREQLLNYMPLVIVTDGTESEKLEWFKTINIPGAALNPQELLNAIYHGPFLAALRFMFSKTGCRAEKVSKLDGKPLMKGSPIRQDLLATFLEWLADSYGTTVQDLVALHQHDESADWAWDYFAKVMEWVKTKFPTYRKEMASVQWGALYNAYKGDPRLASELEAEVSSLMADDEVTKKTGIYKFVFSRNERDLSLRTFTDTEKRTAYEKQGHKCAHCGQVFAYEDMQGDHIVPWAHGGKTTPDNLQMLCCKCNNSKGAH